MVSSPGVTVGLHAQHYASGHGCSRARNHATQMVLVPVPNEQANPWHGFQPWGNHGASCTTLRFRTWLLQG